MLYIVLSNMHNLQVLCLCLVVKIPTISCYMESSQKDLFEAWWGRSSIYCVHVMLEQGNTLHKCSAIECETDITDTVS